MADWLDEQLAAVPKRGAKGAAPSEGTSWLDEQLAAAPKAKAQAAEAAKPQVSTMDDVVQSAGSGLAKGAVSRLGIVGDLHGLMDAAAQLPGRAYNYYLGDGKFELPESMKRARDFVDAKSFSAGKLLPNSADMIRNTENLTGQKFYEPQTTAGKIADSAGTFVGAGANPMSAKSVGLTAAAGASSEGAGLTAEKLGFNPAMQTVARIGGALAPAGLSKVVTPNPISAERKGLVDTLEKEGVPMTAGQKTGNKTLQYAEASTVGVPGGGHGAEKITEAQQRAFTGAAMKRMGEPGKLAEPEVLAAAADRFNTTYRDLAARNSLAIDKPMMKDLGDTLRNYQKNVNEFTRVPVVQETVNDIVKQMVTNGGQIPGAMYQEMRSDLGRRIAGASSGELKGALKDIRKALDDAMTRSISPADATKWKQTNREYANWKAIQPAANAAGENAAQGMISPARLRSSVATQNANAYSKGQGDLNELVRAGTLINPLPNSGTAQRVTATGMMGGAGALAGAALGGGQGAISGASLGAAMGPPVMSRLLMSPLAQKYLGNQVLQPGAVSAGDKLRMMSGLRGLLN